MNDVRQRRTSKPSTPHQSRDAITSPTRRKIVVATAAVWATAVIHAVLLPVHAQTSGVGPLTVRINSADGATGVGGTVTGITPGENVTVVILIDGIPFEVTGTAGPDESFDFTLTPDQITGGGGSIGPGSTVGTTATSGDGGTDSVGDNATVDGPPPPLVTTIDTATQTGGVTGSVTRAMPGEEVTVTFIIGGVEFTVTGTAGPDGTFDFSLSAHDIAAGGGSTKPGTAVGATSTSESGNSDPVRDNVVIEGSGEGTGGGRG